jgi:hypothetical protein
MKSGVVYAKLLYRQNDFLESATDPQITLGRKIAVFRDDLMAAVQCHRHAVDVLDPRDLGPTWRATAELASILARRIRDRIQGLTGRGRWRFRPVNFEPR